MLLKNLSFTLLMLLSFNIYSMERPDEEAPNNEKTATPLSLVKTLKPKKLKFLCAQQLLKNPSTLESLPGELKDYLKNFHKFNALKGHTLAPVFKEYLIRCFNLLSLDRLNEILRTIDKANEISEQKSIIGQRMLPITCRGVFCENPLMALFTLQDIFPQTFTGQFSELLEEEKEFYSQLNVEALTDEENSQRLNILLIIQLTQHPQSTIDSSYVKECIERAKKGSSCALYRIGLIHQATTVGVIYAVTCAKELLKSGSLDYVVELLGFILSATYEVGLFSNDIEFLQQRDFCDFLNQVIETIMLKDNYNDDYDTVLALMYKYLDNNTNAKKHAKQFFTNNPGGLSPILLKLLRDIYKQEDKTTKEAFFSDKLTQIQELMTS